MTGLTLNRGNLLRLMGAGLLAAPFPQRRQVSVPDGVTWKALTPADMEGKGWKDTLAPFDRLPSRAKDVVPEPVWGLSHHSAGMCYRFVTDAPRLWVRWSLTADRLAMPHMAATGVSGVDLYVRRRGDDAWRFAGVGQPTVQKDNTAQINVVAPGEAADNKPRECRLYFPLYNGTERIEIGLPSGSALTAAAPYAANRQKPIIFYGTSITQGGCASRPGMAFPAIVGRKLDVPTINLGFSGNGRMEIALANLISELDTPPSIIVLDCLRNMSEAQVAERVEPFVRRLRETFKADVPILLAEDQFIHNPVQTPRGKLIEASVNKLTKEGLPALTYQPMRYAMGTDGDGTVDGTHPTDLGFMRLGDAFTAALTPLLPK